MLIKQAHLNRIKSKEISLVFRKWKQPTVKKGSLIKTSVGQIEIVNISEIRKEDITLKESMNAGFEKLDDLMKNLNNIQKGNIYKIAVRYHSADPRIELREKTKLSKKEFEILSTKLQRLDKHSKQGEWTINILKAIQDNPKLKAGELASKISKDKAWLKLNIRKLKNLGLTVSHDTGYKISPRGEVLLNRLIKENTTNIK